MFYFEFSAHLICTISVLSVAECLTKISELEMEVSSKEEANSRLQAAHFEEVSALAKDVKGLKVLLKAKLKKYI